MATQAETDFAGQITSPGGFVFGVQGWTWGEPRPKSITFFLDGTAKVCDQHGRPIQGTIVGTVQVYFALAAPRNDDPPNARKHLATHQEVVDALEAERVDWRTLTCAGWPQLPYDVLKQLKQLPPTPVEELKKIGYPTDAVPQGRDVQLRRDALRIRREVDESRAKELQAVTEE